MTSIVSWLTYWQQMLACAKKLDMTDLIAKCSAYLIRTCNTRNALLHYAIAENNKLSTIGKHIFDFIVDHFADISVSRQMDYLPVDTLTAILKSDRLGVKREVDVFNVCWYSLYSLYSAHSISGRLLSVSIELFITCYISNNAWLKHCWLFTGCTRSACAEYCIARQCTKKTKLISLWFTTFSQRLHRRLKVQRIAAAATADGFYLYANYYY